jgi:hypothetical protein
MAMREDDDGAWFAAKRYGFGTGLPIRWQGWAMLAVVIVLVVAVQAWVPRDRIGTKGWLSLILLAGATWIAARHTRGGWRWRWGERD